MTMLVMVLLGLAAGAAIVIQQVLNSGLRNTIDSALWAGVVSYVGGTLSMLLFVALARAPFPSLQAWGRVNAWEWIGGLFGAIYIVVGVVLVPRIGTAAFFALFVLGLMIFSLALDHFGAFGLPRQALTLSKLGGAALIVAGVALIHR
jgi:transporter family-2 protein